MGMPVKLSDALVRQARKAASGAKRSITAQVEYWAGIGRRAERVIPAALLERLGRGEPGPAEHPVLSFFERIADADRRRAAERRLALLRYPRYEADPQRRGGIVAVHADGRRVRGRWDARRNAFVAAAARNRRRA